MTLANILRSLSSSSADQRLDGDLVSRFASSQDEAAFAELLRRHGPMVYGVCRRMLGTSPDADDAFQAVFLVLARKANTIRPPGMVGNWLHGVAVRTANKARVMNARRVNRDRKAATVRAATVREHSSPEAETLALIDAELVELPEVYQAVLVACDLNGKSRSEVARELGWPEGTVASRLAKARELLAERLRKRGVTLGLGAFATVLVPQAMASATLATVSELLTVGTASAVAPVAQQLSEEVIKMMTVAKVKLLAIWMMALTFIAGAATMVADAGDKPGPAVVKTQIKNAPVPKAEQPDGLLWLYHDITREIIALAPDGTKVKEFKVPDDPYFLGLSPDGKKMAFAGKNGKVAAGKDKVGLTVHLRDIGPGEDGTDTGLKYDADDFLLWSPDVTRVIQHRKTGGYDLYDLATKRLVNLQIPAGHWVAGWSPDGTWLLVCSGELPNRVLWCNWGKFTLADGKLQPITMNRASDKMSIAPDGKSIIGYASERTAKEVNDTDPPHKWNLVRIDVATGKATNFEKFSLPYKPTGGATYLAPGGDRMAFWGTLPQVPGKSNDFYRLSILDKEGGEVREVKRFDSNAWSLLGWFPNPRAARPEKNAPKPKAPEWKEVDKIEFTKGKVTSVAYSPSGKVIGIARDNGLLSFHRHDTRQFITNMDIAGEKGVTAATFTTLAFKPTPHPKLGEVFAVTHKNGVKFGTIGLGLFAEDAAMVEGIPIPWTVKDLNANQLKWIGDESLVASNGKQLEWRFRLDGKQNKLDFNWEVANGKLHQPIVLEAIPGHNSYFLSNDNRYQETNIIDIVVAPPGSSPQAQLTGHKSRPFAAVMSKDGKRLVTADVGSLIFWEGDKLNFREKSRIEQGPGLVQVALSSDGKTVAVLLNHGVKWLGGPANRSSEIFELFVFDFANPPKKLSEPIWKSETRSMPGKRSGPVSLTFSPDGKTLLMALCDPFTDDTQKYGEIPKSVGVKVFELQSAK